MCRPRSSDPIELALAVAAFKRDVKGTGGRERIGEALGIDGGFNHAGRDVRPRHEGRIADQGHPLKSDLQRRQIKDRLKDDLRRGLDQRRELGRKQRTGISFESGDQLGPDQRRRDRQAVAAS
jgi:hypothetical protein